MDESIQKQLEKAARRALGRAALQAIERRMEDVPEEVIDMGVWCGTSQCAMGHCISLPEVRATGIFYSRINGVMYPNHHDVSERGDMCEVISTAFGISADSAWNLFIEPMGKREFLRAIRKHLSR